MKKSLFIGFDYEELLFTRINDFFSSLDHTMKNLFI